jgi:hypothetical protein
LPQVIRRFKATINQERRRTPGPLQFLQIIQEPAAEQKQVRGSRFAAPTIKRRCSGIANFY